jgi:hypothetical protein
MIYNGSYPYDNSRWRKVKSLTDEEAKDFAFVSSFEIKCWTNKAFKITDDSLRDYLEHGAKYVRAVYQHDSNFYLIETDKKESIIEALEYEKQWHEQHAYQLKNKIQNVVDLKKT